MENDKNKLNNNELPMGISRLRKEWDEFKSYAGTKPQDEEIVFTEIDGQVGVGDYVYTVPNACARLALSQEAVERLVASGEIDSVTLKMTDGTTQKMISKASLLRFEEDSLIDTGITQKAALALENAALEESVASLREELDLIKQSQAKMIQQMKDIILLELRNIKEQDRDLTSYVYELAEEIKTLLPKKRKK